MSAAEVDMARESQDGPDSPEPENGGRKRGCQCHCADGCGAHFAGLGAFDRHRAGPPGARYCLEPADVVDDHGAPVFVAKVGVPCTLGRPAELSVTVWGLAASGYAA